MELASGPAWRPSVSPRRGFPDPPLGLSHPMEQGQKWPGLGGAAQEPSAGHRKVEANGPEQWAGSRGPTLKAGGLTQVPQPFQL